MIYSQIYYIDPDEGVRQVEGKIKKTRQKKIVLVLPQENKTLKNARSLSFLQKTALEEGKRLFVFTTDSGYRRLAEELKIPIEESLIEGSFLAGKEIGFRPKVRDIFPRSEVQRPPTILRKREWEEPREEEEKKKKRIKITAIENYIGFLILAIVMGFGIWSLLAILPKAKIVLFPASEDFEFKGEFLAKEGATLDLKGNILPAKVISKEKKLERSFIATGKEFKESKAEGKIVIYNESGSPYHWRPSRFESSDGKIFWSKDDISIPPGSRANPGKVEINVIADKAGEEYNIGPSDFRIPALKEQGRPSLYNQIYGKSSEPMKGGAKGETTVVKEEDLEKARKELTSPKEELILNLKEEMIKETPPNLQSLLKERISITKDEIVFDKKSKEVAGSFKATIILEGRVLSFNEENFEGIIFGIISPRLRKDIEYEEITKPEQIDYRILEYNIEKSEMRISFEGSQRVAVKVDPEKFKKSIKGISASEFQKYIIEEMGGRIKNAQISLWPFWAKKIPKDEKRISIEIKYE